MDGWTDGIVVAKSLKRRELINRWMDGWTIALVVAKSTNRGELINRWMDGWMDGWVSCG